MEILRDSLEMTERCINEDFKAYMHHIFELRLQERILQSSVIQLPSWL